jgi:lipase chaperone LimK
MRAALIALALAACEKQQPAPPAPAPAIELRAPIRVRAPLPPPPRSLADTEIDGAFTRGPDGAVVADEQAREVFDYFLTAEGEDTMTTIRARIADVARRDHVDPDAALALFDRYLAYRADGATRFSHPVDDPEQAIAQLQRDHFGDDAPRFFTP